MALKRVFITNNIVGGLVFISNCQGDFKFIRGRAGKRNKFHPFFYTNGIHFQT